MDGENALAGFPLSGSPAPREFISLGRNSIHRLKGDHEMEKLNQMKRRIKRQKGVTVVEYALMLALVAIAVALATPNIASAVINVFSKASSVMAK